MARYQFELTGTMPLLMHADNIREADRLMAWRKDPKNKSVSTPGDDRSPAWTWKCYAYRNSKGVIALPSYCLMASLRTAGAKINTKGKATLKSLSQSAIFISTDYLPFTVEGKSIDLNATVKFNDEPFEKHEEEVRKLGFELDLMRATVGSSKHVRVRPRFDVWEVKGELETTDAAITQPVLAELFELAGRLSGLGDWRPSAPRKPGSYGTFSTTLKKIG